jgi:hypothetical protein
VEGLPSKNVFKGLDRQTDLTASIESKEIYRRSANLREDPPDKRERRPAVKPDGAASREGFRQKQEHKFHTPPQVASVVIIDRRGWVLAIVAGPANARTVLRGGTPS